VLLVSPRPPVVFADTEFVPADWTVTAFAQPAQGGPTFVTGQALTGGNPGAHRTIEYRMTPAPSALRLVHFPVASTYTTAMQGEIRSVDLTVDCDRTAASSALLAGVPGAWPAFEQAGRVYTAPGWSFTCTSWYERRHFSLLATDFSIMQGSACSFNESCPNFSAGAPPLRFGIVTELSLSGSEPGGTLTQKVDNWKATVWTK
jgi:hypothetical protein